jgi:hypothetical protein
MTTSIFRDIANALAYIAAHTPIQAEPRAEVALSVARLHAYAGKDEKEMEERGETGEILVSGVAPTIVDVQDGKVEDPEEPKMTNGQIVYPDISRMNSDYGSTNDSDPNVSSAPKGPAPVHMDPTTSSIELPDTEKSA